MHGLRSAVYSTVHTFVLSLSLGGASSKKICFMPITNDSLVSKSNLYSVNISTAKT